MQQIFFSIASDLKTNNSTRQTFDPYGYRQFLTNSAQNSMYITPVDSSEIFEITKNFKNKAKLDSKIPALKIVNELHASTDILAALLNQYFEQNFLNP